MTIKTATPYAIIREDLFGAATLIQNHETALRALFAQQPARAEAIREMATTLFDALDAAHHDATSGKVAR